MDEHNLLQEQLQRLEDGEPLETCLADLPPTEAEVLQLAAALRALPHPSRNAAIVQSQRAALMKLAAADNNPIQQPIRQRRITEAPAAIQAWLRQRTALEWIVFAALAPALL